ncbi:MAG: bifunctional glutamate N-acetyltransferase/amino-acid acetyltransferase ArgJ [Peptococcia bacterium]
MNYELVSGGGVTSATGFVAGVAQAAIKKADGYDLTLLYSTVPAVGAGVFTQNVFRAAPVIISQQNLSVNDTEGTIRGIVVNSGCANACTGQQGLLDAQQMAQEAAKVFACEETEILVASTGVIGVNLPMERVIAGIHEAGNDLSAANGGLAAQAIMTTDTVSKEIAIKFYLGEKEITLGGMAKGSGMIHPNMATMLGFITTDAAISGRCLKKSLQEAVGKSFNMVTVDGDCSTNDSLFVLANGLAENQLIMDENSQEYQIFTRALTYVCTELAKMIARDGEGATKLMEVRVINAPNPEDARLGAKAIAGSNLVKAALFGEDANWGRIVCALGYSGASFQPMLVDVYLGDLLVAQNGGGLAFDEEMAARILQEDTVIITVDMKQGSSQATAWGCDLTYDYVKINGEYRT